MSDALAALRLHDMLGSARGNGASDIHVAPGKCAVMRVDGALQVHSQFVFDQSEVEAILEELLPERARRQLESRGDAGGTFRGENAGNVRLHAHRSAAGTALAFRMLAASVPRLDTLGLPPVVASFARRSSGLVLFAGPTGSGKTTALAALVDAINRSQSKHIVTLEDPIEYEHHADRSFITQRQIGSHARSFAHGILAALRCDPDVLLIGEMRDAQTMHAALTAAETGHLVFATLHTGDAPQTIDRIVGAFPAESQEQIRLQLAQTLAAVVCLRLIPRTGGCGRRCASEVLVANDAVRTLIRDAKTHQLRNLITTSRRDGMQTLEADLCELVAQGEIALEHALQVTERPGEVKACGLGGAR